MPRTARAAVAGVCYHVMNRGNARATVFHDDADYRTFLELMREAGRRAPVSVFAFCLMPNHFHVVLRPASDSALGAWMHWLLTSHVRRHHRRRGSEGRVWQGRFKAFPIEADRHLLTVLRYVERNALRAGLVERAQDWQWGSLHARDSGADGLIAVPPLELSETWTTQVNEALTAAEADSVRQSVRRGTPFGTPAWVRQTASRLGLGHTLRPPGRPRRQADRPT